MAVKKTSQIGERVIRTKAKAVKDSLSKEVQKTIKDLVDSMRDKDLVGMAAPQIGKGERIFVTEIRETKYRKRAKKRDPDPLRIFINPKVVSFSKKEVKDFEGCGSVVSAGLFGVVQRPESLVVRALNENGEKFELEAKGLLARIIQHEMDHINGVVFTDKADPKTLIGKDQYLENQKKI